MKQKIHKRKIAFIVLASLVCSPTFSQNFAKNWLLGNFGLEFRTDTVVVRRDYASHENRGMGVISDKYGNLLCYTDGFNIWNKNHAVMPNGRNILYLPSSPLTQESMIISKPGSESEYYVFTVDAYSGQDEAGLYYSIVDINLDNGLGDVTVKAKKILDKTTNKITAVYHNNGKDVWIITHVFGTNKYYAYLLSDAGLAHTPVISSVGNSLESSFDGQLKASPDGEKIACSYFEWATDESFSLFDFNNSTGQLTNPLSFILPVSGRGCYGLEFSPDAKKIFVDQTGSTGEEALYQFDISRKTYAEINNSRTLLFKPYTNSMGQMQLAPDGRIYFAKGGGQYSGSKYLGVIENSNEWGENCIVRELGLYLDDASASVAKTPNFIQNYFFKTGFTFSNACSGHITDFQITNEMGLDSVRWNFGQGSASTSKHPQCSYDAAGDYTVTLLAYYPQKTDTIRKKITINPSPEFDLGNDTTVCYGYELSVAEGFQSYFWNTGDNTRSIIIKQSGSYKLTVENEYGCQFSDSIYLNVTELPVIELPDSIQLGTRDSILVNAGNFKSYYWSTGETMSSIYIKNEGWYSVTVENEAGCTATKPFYVYIDQITEDPNEWKLLNPQPSALTGLDVCFLNSQVGYVLNDNQIIGTSDGGTTWKVLMKITSGKRMAFKENYGYIIGDYGTIYKSTYMGSGWNKLNTGFTDNLTGVSVISKDTVFVTSVKKLYSSFDGGENWNTSDIVNGYISVTGSCFTSSSAGHASCSNGDVYKTIDGGKTWMLKRSVNYFPAEIHQIYFVNSSTGFISMGHSTILKTTDAGETWNEIASTSDRINKFYFLNEQTGFISGEHGVVFKTGNGGNTWNWIGFQNGRYAGSDIYGIYFIDNATGYLAGMGGRILKTTDGGVTWNGYASTYNEIKQFKLISNTTGYGLVGNSFIKTTDGGDKWNNIGAPLPTGNIRQFVFVNENTGYCIAGGDINTSGSVAKVFKTTNGGNTWTATNSGNNLMSDNLYSIDFVDENTGYASGGFNDRTTFKTSNGGNTWTRINDYSLGQMQFINSSVGYARNVGNLYNNIYKTVDGGENWTSTFLIDKDIKSFHFLNENLGYFVGDGSLMYKTSDGGATWEKITVPYGYYVNVRFYSPNVGFITDEYGVSYQTDDGGVNWTQLNKPYSVAGIDLYKNEIYAYGGNGVIMKKKIEYKPVVLTLATSNITNKSIVLFGNISSNDVIINNIKFEYGINSLSNYVDIPDSVQPNASLYRSVKLEDLESDKTYLCRLSATVNGTLYTSNILQFKTLPDYEMNMDYVYAVWSNDAEVTGSIVSHTSDITDIEFQYGTDNTLNHNTIAQPNIVSGGTSSTITARLQLLEPKTRYFVRIKGNYNGTEIFSSPVAFTTADTHIISISNPYIDGNDATFYIYISANKDTIQNITLEYGTTHEYKNQVSIPGQIDKGSANYVSAQITGLNPATVYYYRIKADMGTETIYSKENILKLQGGIVMVPIEVKQLSDSSVLLQGLVNPHGEYAINVRFQYGQNGNLENSVSAMPNNVYGYTTTLVSSTLNHLTSNVEYHARIVVTDYADNYHYSSEFTFTLYPMGLRNPAVTNEVLIYPNPADNFVFIKSEKPINKIEVYDLNGKCCLMNENEHKIIVSQLPEGIYFVRIFTGNEVVSKKLIKK